MGQCCRWQTETLWELAVRSPVPSSIPVGTQCLYTPGIRIHGWPSSPPKMPSWITMAVKWSTLWRITYKYLVIFDNAPGYIFLNRWSSPQYQTGVFFPPNTSLMQPLYQGVIATFKTYCWGLLSRLLPQPRKTLMQFCKNYTYDAHQEPCMGLGVMSLRSVWMAAGRRHSRSLSVWLPGFHVVFFQGFMDAILYTWKTTWLPQLFFLKINIKTMNHFKWKVQKIM